VNAWRGTVRAVLSLRRVRSWSGWSRRLLAGLLAMFAASGVLWWSPSVARAPSDGATRVGVAGAAGDLPSARIVICGAQRGRLEPCGCSTPQRGGLDRLAALLRRLQTAGPVEPRVVQFGPALGRSDRRIDALKYATFHAAWRHMGIHAVHAGSHDLAVGPIGDGPAPADAPVASEAARRSSATRRIVRSGPGRCRAPPGTRLPPVSEARSCLAHSNRADCGRRVSSSGSWNRRLPRVPSSTVATLSGFWEWKAMTTTSPP